MSRVGFTHTEFTGEVAMPGDKVILPFNGLRPTTLLDLISRNKYWEGCNTQEQGGPPQNILWFGCIDAVVSEICSTLTLPGGIIAYRNFGNLFQGDASAKAALEHARTQTDKDYDLTVVVVGHDNCRAIQLAKAAVAGDSSIPDVIINWIQPLIELVNNNENATIEQLSELNVEEQVKNIKDFFIGFGGGGGVVVSGANYNANTGILHA